MAVSEFQRQFMTVMDDPVVKHHRFQQVVHVESGVIVVFRLGHTMVPGREAREAQHRIQEAMKSLHNEMQAVTSWGGELIYHPIAPVHSFPDPSDRMKEELIKAAAEAYPDYRHHAHTVVRTRQHQSFNVHLKKTEEKK